MNILKQIIIADINLIWREKLKSAFENCGKYQVLEAETYGQIIDEVELQDGNIDLIILGSNLKEKTWIEVLASFKERGFLDQIPVIVAVDKIETKEEVEAYNYGVADFISKECNERGLVLKSDNLISLYESKRKLLNADRAIKIEQQDYDPLTGLMTMKNFLESADKFIKSLEGDSYKDYFFAYGNIRNFKYYNIKYGMASGDLILKELANLLIEEPSHIFCGRINQDHMVILSKNKRIKESTLEIDDAFTHKYRNFGMLLQIGVYRLRSTDEDAHRAFEFAKLACDSIKRTTKAYCEYDEELGKRVAINQYVIHNLENALNNKWIKVYYQPVLRTITGAICGFEALARWSDPRYGLLLPVNFIKVLEESGQIYKLDQYMIREVCHFIRENQENGYNNVPISLNLSQMDFEQCDIVGYVEDMAQKHNVPRDMLNIELTESAIATNQNTVMEYVDQLRDLGYEVWMDDFGSGYSSFNVLKNLHIDELKMDLEFMRNYDETSKHMLMSIVNTAKKMGLTTLGEGVESKEQFEFLRNIGCDKVQGYYISKPLPAKELNIFTQRLGYPYESRVEKIHYQKLRDVDFITGRTLAIVELYNDKLNFIFVNDAFREEWNIFGTGDFFDAINIDYDYNANFWKSFKMALQSQEVSQDFHDGEYSYKGNSLRIYSRCLSRTKQRSLFQLELINTTKADADLPRPLSMIAYKAMLSMQDIALLVDVDKNSIEIIRRGPLDSSHLDKNFKNLTPRKCVAFAAENYVHRDDRVEFMRFCDLDTIKERIERSESGFLATYFRMRISTGAYVWKIHYIAKASKADTYFYCNKAASVNQPGLLERVNKAIGIDGRVGTMGIALDTLMESQTINFFWKDRERRFLGANRCFLNTYGFDSVDEIIGKTDEDMGWHVNGEALKDDEEDVIRSGVCVKERLGRCIIKGVSQDILVSKEPIYENGEIIGLWGCFIKVQNIVRNFESGPKLELIDPTTGVLSTRGAMPIILEYIEGFKIRQEDYAVITVNLPRYKDDFDDYGNHAMSQTMIAIGEVLKKNVGVKGNCVGFQGGAFAVYLKYEDMAEVEKIVEDIRRDISNIHTVDYFPITLRPDIDVFYAKDAVDMRDLIWHSMLLAVFKDMEAFAQSYEEWELTVNILDRLPCIAVVFSRSKEGELTRKYISKNAITILGEDDPISDEPHNIMSRIYPDDYSWVKKRIEETVAADEGMDETYRIINKHGEVYWIRHTATAIPEADGSCTFYAIYIDVTEQKKSEEEKKQTLASRYGDYFNNRFDPNELSQILSVADFQGAMRRSIAEVYISMHIIDLNNDSYMTIACEQYVADVLRFHKSAQAAMDKVVEILVMPSSQKDVKKFFDLSTLSERLKGKKSLAIDFSGALTGWCRGIYIPSTYNEDGSLREVLFMVEYIQAEKNKEDNLKKIAETDGLSQLLNRVSGEKYIDKYLSEDRLGLFCLFDIDNFKYYNDNYGHAFGDEIIKRTGECMKKVFRSEDILMRIGGDEFAIYAPGIRDRAIAENRIQDLEDSIRTVVPLSANEAISLSVGVLFVEGKEYYSFDEIYRETDNLMYTRKREKKRRVKNSYEHFNKSR